MIDIPWYVGLSIGAILYLIYFCYEARKYWWGWLFAVASAGWLAYFVYSLVSG